MGYLTLDEVKSTAEAFRKRYSSLKVAALARSTPLPEDVCREVDSFLDPPREAEVIEAVRCAGVDKMRKSVEQEVKTICSEVILPRSVNGETSGHFQRDLPLFGGVWDSNPNGLNMREEYEGVFAREGLSANVYGYESNGDRVLQAVIGYENNCVREECLRSLKRTKTESPPAANDDRDIFAKLQQYSDMLEDECRAEVRLVIQNYLNDYAKGTGLRSFDGVLGFFFNDTATSFEVDKAAALDIVKTELEALGFQDVEVKEANADEDVQNDYEDYSHAFHISVKW